MSRGAGVCKEVIKERKKSPEAYALMDSEPRLALRFGRGRVFLLAQARFNLLSRLKLVRVVHYMETEISTPDAFASGVLIYAP